MHNWIAYRPPAPAFPACYDGREANRYGDGNRYTIVMDIFMQVAKWGNSLAVRLPSAVVEALNLKEGDQIEIRVAGSREFEIARDPGIDRALERIRQLRRPLPAGFKFDRLEANERG